MTVQLLKLLSLSLLIFPGIAGAVPKTEEQKIIYKSGKDVNFEALLIQGKLKRPAVSVVTGNVAQGADGLLRLRENFMDRVASDSGEEATP